MKKFKIFVSILMIFISLIIFRQIDSYTMNRIFSGPNNSLLIGFVMATAYLSSAIIYLFTRAKNTLNGEILVASIMGCSGFISFITADTLLRHLGIWIVLGFIIGFGFLNWHLITEKYLPATKPVLPQRDFIPQRSSTYVQQLRLIMLNTLPELNIVLYIADKLLIKLFVI